MERRVLASANEFDAAQDLLAICLQWAEWCVDALLESHYFCTIDR